MAYTPNFSQAWNQVHGGTSVRDHARAATTFRQDTRAKDLREQAVREELDTVRSGKAKTQQKDEAIKMGTELVEIANSPVQEQRNRLASVRQRLLSEGARSEAIKGVEALMSAPPEAIQRAAQNINAKLMTEYGVDIMGNLLATKNAPRALEADIGHKEALANSLNAPKPGPTTPQITNSEYLARLEHNLNLASQAGDSDGVKYFQGQIENMRNQLKKVSGTTVNIDTTSKAGSIPPGWALNQDKNGKYTMEVIPGGPAEEELKDKELALEKKKIQGKYLSAIVSEDVDRSIQMVVDNPFFTTGLVGGQVLANLGGTDARNLEAMLTSIKANVGFKNLQMLREASPTGGALGPVSDTENKLLQAAFGSVEQSVSAEQLIFNLKRLKSVYNLVVHGHPESPTISDIVSGTEPNPSAPPDANQEVDYNSMDMESLEQKAAELRSVLGQ